MPSDSRWAIGSNQYRKRPKPATAPAPDLDAYPTLAQNIASLWVPPSPRIAPRDSGTAALRFASTWPIHVQSMSAFEGINITLPQVQTLIDGVSVDGIKVTDVAAVLDMYKAHQLTYSALNDGTFNLDRTSLDQLNQAITQNEVIEPGIFRGQGQVGGGGTVSLGGGRYYQAPAPEYLETLWVEVCARAREMPPLPGAAYLFATGALAQYYSNGNKRTARLLASGHLMTHGFDAILIETPDRARYNNALSVLFSQIDAEPITKLIYDVQAKTQTR